ncbi:DUF3040 domain-containing protein [Actinomadura logoneensis]|uniref:DUF3040 domain-containing protein n=1 Tax=Actinomadura logoneensis TaxID=2293572 RepID=A0A372JQT0_9ACTN|nr:DUF3040 domain-containing protein [Actinomadura logoneensis]RFU42392.1 DUF3040 domain-containing protein [Actinomadura logoneensis]
MALSTEEQRILAEIETRLAEDDPRLARRLAAHRGTSRRRVRLVTAAVVAAVGVVTALVSGILTAFS